MTIVLVYLFAKCGDILLSYYVVAAMPVWTFSSTPVISSAIRLVHNPGHPITYQHLLSLKLPRSRGAC